MEEMNRHWAEKNDAKGVTDMGYLSKPGVNGITVVTYRCNVNGMRVANGTIEFPVVRVEIDVNGIHVSGIGAAGRAILYRDAISSAIDDSMEALPDDVYDDICILDDAPAEGMDLGPDQHALGALIYAMDENAAAWLAGDEFMERVHSIAIEVIGKTFANESKLHARAEANRAKVEAKAAAKAEAKAKKDAAAKAKAEADAAAQAKADAEAQERQERFELKAGKPEWMSSEGWAQMQSRARAGTLSARELERYIGYLAAADGQYSTTDTAGVNRRAAHRDAIRARENRLMALACERNASAFASTSAAIDPAFGRRQFAA